LAPGFSPTASEAHKPGEEVEVEIAKGVLMKFCWIPAGEAQLGSPKDEDDDEEKRGRFQTRGFWMGKYAVTQEEWGAVMGDNPSFFVPSVEQVKKDGIDDTSRFPVERVSCDDCQEFLTRVNDSARLPATMGKGKFLLPHEGEWEYACRGGKGNKQPYYFGWELNGRQANCDGNYPFGTSDKGPYKGRTTAVDSYESVAPHPWGLCDMHGNVRQWCYEYERPGRTSTFAVLRGGSWNSFASYCRAASRFSASAFRMGDVGFRVVVRLD
jgi:formylglycine-generating enzyme required for sulfatase activity